MLGNLEGILGNPGKIPHIIWKIQVKWGFHGQMNRADKSHKTADLLDFEKIFSRCQ